MKKFAIGCGILLAILIFFGVIFGIFLAVGYNRLVPLNQNTNSKWAEVETQYQRRADLIPNLVQTVQGAANFEKSTLTDVINARANATKMQVQLPKGESPTDPAALQQFQQAQDQLSGALGRLLVVVERYPQLTATEQFKELQAQLEGTENRIAVARRDFNDAVQAYNVAVQRFPTALYAGLFGFHQKPYFTAAPGAETAPKVQFNFNNTNPAAPPALPAASAPAAR